MRCQLAFLLTMVACTTVFAAKPPINYIAALNELSIQQPTTLSNEDIIHLVEAGIAADTIVAKIKASACHFETSTDALIALKTKGVPEAVLTAMVQATQPASVTNESFSSIRAREVRPLSPEVLAERAQHDAICPTCKFLLISYVDPKTGVVTDSRVSNDQMTWLKSDAEKTKKEKRPAKFFVTRYRENADYILFWTEAQGFIPYVTYVPRTETTTSNVSGTYSTIGTSGYGFGTVNGNVVVTRTYYEAQSNEWPYVDAALTVYDQARGESKLFACDEQTGAGANGQSRLMLPLIADGVRP